VLILFDTLKQAIAIYWKCIALNRSSVCRSLARRDLLWRAAEVAAAGHLPGLWRNAS